MGEKLAGPEGIGNKIMSVVFLFIGVVIAIALGVQLSPTIVNYISQLGQQMQASNSTLVQVLGNIVSDYGGVIWYGGLVGGTFATIYATARKLFE